MRVLRVAWWVAILLGLAVWGLVPVCAMRLWGY